MIKARLFTLAASGLLFLTPLTGQAAKTLPESADASAPAIELLTERWASDHIEGRFLEKKTIAGFPKPLVSSGVFTIDKKTGVVWTTQKPFPNTLYFDDRGVRYAGENAASSVSAGDVPAVGHLAEMIRGILAGDLDMLSRLFTLDVTLEPVPTVRARPKDPALAGAVSDIVISGRDAIESIRLTGAAGDVTDLTLTDLVRR